MRSLFLKIFLWFWLAMALVVIGFVVLVTSTQEERAPGRDGRDGRGSRAGSRRGPDVTMEALRTYLYTGAQVLEHDGAAALAVYLHRLQRTGHIRTFLFNARGAALLQHQPAFNLNPQLQQINPAELKQLVQRAAHSHTLQVAPSGPLLLAALRAGGPRRGMASAVNAQAGVARAETYIIVGAMRGSFFRSPPSERRADGNRPPRRGGPYQFWLWWLSAGPGIQVLRLLAVLALTGIVCYGLVRHIVTPILQLRTATHRLAAGDLSTRVGATLGRRRDELGVLGRDFDLMAERIESLMKAQNRLIADISHELRSPLARMGVALVLVRESAGPEATEDLDRIQLETERLNTMIGQLLTLSRLESGEQVAAHIPVDLAQLVRDIAADADFEARSRNRSVRVVAATECTITGTPALLRSAIENVVRNAVRYTQEGTVVEIRLSRQEDGAALQEENASAKAHLSAHLSSPVPHPLEHAVIQVRDQGPGVPEEELPHLFRPFYRIADARDRQSGGTGLGLAITERAVRLHGGLVTAANAPAGGLLIEIRLPLAGRAKAEAGAPDRLQLADAAHATAPRLAR